MGAETISIYSHHSGKSTAEKATQAIFTGCGLFAVPAIASTILYMIISGMSTLFKVDILETILGTARQPAAASPNFGIFFAILASTVGTFLVILVGVPIGVMTAIFLVEVAPKKLMDTIRPAVELSAGTSSVVYGLLGILILNPLTYKIELIIFKGSEVRQFTGDADLISAILALALMILPTVINISGSSLRTIPSHLKSVSLVLGTIRIQTIFQVIVPAAKSGITTAAVLRTDRVIDEAMAISPVSGSTVNLPLPFNSVRFLTTIIVSEMRHAAGLRRQVLSTIGLVLFVFIMRMNISLTRIPKKGEKKSGR